MARLRFPGRPGYRHSRTGITYGVGMTDGPQNQNSDSQKVIASIYQGLRLFHELFGDSDDEVSVKLKPPDFRPLCNSRENIVIFKAIYLNFHQS